MMSNVPLIITGVKSNEWPVAQCEGARWCIVAHVSLWQWWQWWQWCPSSPWRHQHYQPAWLSRLAVRPCLLSVATLPRFSPLWWEKYKYLSEQFLILHNSLEKTDWHGLTRQTSLLYTPHCWCQQRFGWHLICIRFCHFQQTLCDVVTKLVETVRKLLRLNIKFR